MTQNKNKLIADEGMTLTNGNAFGKTVWLASDDDSSFWYEVSDTQAAVLKHDKEQAEAAYYQSIQNEARTAVNSD